MARLYLAVLGGFQARLEPGPVLTLPARKTTALLTYLAMPAGQAHPREKLAALLWGDAAAVPARNALRQTLFTLRRILARADPLRLQGDSVALDPAAVDVDVCAFEREVTDGSPEALERGMDLYRGDLLAGLTLQSPPFEEWLLAERERLREVAMGALARLLAQRRAAGALEPAVKTALRLLALDPLQEPTHRTLMRLYAESGRRGAALRQYQVCVKSLQRELSAEPETETKELYQHILRMRPARSDIATGTTPPRTVGPAPSEPVSPLPSPGGEPALVGRAPEVERLRAALAAAAGGRGSFVGILAEAGLGKSRLVDQLTTDAAARGVQVLLGRAYEAAQILSYGPWVDALRIARAADDQDLLQSLDPIRRGALSRLLPGVPASPPPGPVEPVHAFEALTQLIEQMSRRQPLILVLEDLHWGDEMSVRLLAFVARRIRAWAALGVVTVRDEDLAVAPLLTRTLTDLQRAQQLDVIRLAPLSRAETIQLARLHAPHQRPDDREFEERIWRISEGHPLIVAEVMRVGGPGAMIEPDSAVPSERVRELIGRRLDRLGRPGRQIVAAAAIIGRESDFDLLRATARLDEEEAAEGLEELVRHGILHRVGEGFAFAHDRIREVAYAALLPPRKRLLHRRVAEILEALHGSNLTPHLRTLGTHYRFGEVWEKAAHYLEKAGAAAADKSAHRSAALAYEEALGAVSHLPDSPLERTRTCDLHFARAYALGWSGAIDLSLEGHTRAVALAEALQDGPRLRRVLVGHVSALASTGRHLEALAVGERALGEAIAAQDFTSQFWGNLNLARVCYALGNYQRSAEHARQCAACLARVPALSGAVTRDLPPPVAYRCWLVQNLAMLGDFAAAIALGRELTALVAPTDWPRARVSTAFSMGILWLSQGDLEPAISILEPALRLCREAELWAFLPRIAACLGTALTVAGRTTDGLALLEEAVTQSRSIGYLYNHAGLLCDLATGYQQAGRFTESGHLAEEALALARAQAERGSEVAALRLSGQSLTRRDPPDETGAQARLQESVALAEGLGARPAAARSRLALAALHRRLGQFERAGAELDLANGEFRAMAMTGWLAHADKLR